MRYEGVLRAKTSVALVAGVILVVTGCGRVASHVTTSPLAEVSPSTAATQSTTVESPAAATPGAAPTVPATHPPSPRSAPSPTPRSSASAPATPPPLAIAGVSFPTGEVGIGYPTISLGASGGIPPYTWSIGSGALPGGLTLSANTISGTPTVGGPFPFTVNVSDSAGGAAGAAQSVTIVAPLSVAGRCDASPCSVEQGCDATCGSFGSQSGGLAPFKYALSGVLPPGTALNGLALTGQFTTVSAAAPFTFAVTVTDALGASGGVKAAITVFPHIFLRGGTFTGLLKIPFTVPLGYSGGAGIPKVGLGKGTLPPNATLSVDPKGSQVIISVPAQSVTGSYVAVLVLIDGSPCSAGANCAASATVTINLG